MTGTGSVKRGLLYSLSSFTRIAALQVHVGLNGKKVNANLCEKSRVDQYNGLDGLRMDIRMDLDV